MAISSNKYTLAELKEKWEILNAELEEVKIQFELGGEDKRQEVEKKMQKVLKEMIDQLEEPITDEEKAIFNDLKNLKKNKKMSENVGKLISSYVGPKKKSYEERLNENIEKLNVLNEEWEKYQKDDLSEKQRHELNELKSKYRVLKNRFGEISTEERKDLATKVPELLPFDGESQEDFAKRIEEKKIKHKENIEKADKNYQQVWNTLSKIEAYLDGETQQVEEKKQEENITQDLDEHEEIVKHQNLQDDKGEIERQTAQAEEVIYYDSPEENEKLSDEELAQVTIMQDDENWNRVLAEYEERQKESEQPQEPSNTAEEIDLDDLGRKIEEEVYNSGLTNMAEDTIEENEPLLEENETKMEEENLELSIDDAEDLEEVEIEEEEITGEQESIVEEEKENSENLEESLEQVEEVVSNKKSKAIYDYRKNLPFVNYSNIDIIEKVQSQIQNKIYDAKGKFISSESGKVRSAIRKVAIATNSKDIDATKLLNELYEKKSFFNKELKISSKELPDELNSAFESFKRQFNVAIDEGKLSKEDQEAIYEYIIRPRELVHMKDDIINGKFKENPHNEMDSSDADKFRNNLKNQTEEIHEIDNYTKEHDEEKVIKKENQGKVI